MRKTILIKGMVQRLAVLLPTLCCALSIYSQTSITERLNYVLEMQDMDMGIKLYNEITEVDLAQLPDSTLFDYHYLGGYLNSQIPNHDKSIEHLLKAKILCDTSLGSYSIGYMEIMKGLGDEYIEIGKYDDALAIFQEGIVRSMAVRDGAPLAFGNLIMGVYECYEYMGWYNEIPAHLADAWGFWPKDEEPFATYNYFPLWNLHQFYRRYEMYDKALQASDAILEFIAQKVGAENPEIVHELYMRGNTLSKMGKKEDAVETYYKGLSILKPIPENVNEIYGQILGNLLSNIIYTSRWEEYKTVLLEIKDYGDRTRDATIYKNALFSAANDFENIGNYELAQCLNQELLGLPLTTDEQPVVENQRDRISNNRGLIESLSQLEVNFNNLSLGSSDWFETAYNLSCAYFINKDIAKNIDVLSQMNQAIIKHPSNGDDYRLWVLNNLYGAYFDNEDNEKLYDIAIEKNRYVLSLSDATDAHRFKGINDLVVAKLKSGNLEDIDSDLEIVNKLSASLFGEDTNTYSVFLHNRGRAYQLQGKMEDARNCFLQAIYLQRKTTGEVSNGTVKYLMEVEQSLSDI